MIARLGVPALLPSMGQAPEDSTAKHGRWVGIARPNPRPLDEPACIDGAYFQPDSSFASFRRALWIRTRAVDLLISNLAQISSMLAPSISRAMMSKRILGLKDCKAAQMSAANSRTMSARTGSGSGDGSIETLSSYASSVIAPMLSL